MAARANRPLYEKTWVLSYINGKKVEPGESGKTPQLQFSKADGKVTGNTGCNNLTGTFSNSGDGAMKFGVPHCRSALFVFVAYPKSIILTIISPS